MHLFKSHKIIDIYFGVITSHGQNNLKVYSLCQISGAIKDIFIAETKLKKPDYHQQSQCTGGYYSFINSNTCTVLAPSVDFHFWYFFPSFTISQVLFS